MKLTTESMTEATTQTMTHAVTIMNSTASQKPGAWPAWRWLAALLLVLFSMASAIAAPPRFAQVLPDGKPIQFPADFGAHPDHRTEWWYATGWLQTDDGKPLGFQITFFRSATEHDAANPSAFAPRQLIIAHAALSDPADGKLLHDQKSAREGFGLAYAKQGNTDVKLGDWRFVREESGIYRATIPARDFTMTLTLQPTQPPMLQGDKGYSQKGPRPEQASRYYSEPQLKVSGTIRRNGNTQTVTGTAWLDHEWFSSALDESVAGWDWTGANLEGGGALMVIRIRGKDGSTVWASASLRDAAGNITQFKPGEVRFTPLRRWRSPRTKVEYPVAMQVDAGPHRWQLVPLQDDQELDSRQSTGVVYWEGAVKVLQDDKTVGHGYLELTGYLEPLKL